MPEVDLQDTTSCDVISRILTSGGLYRVVENVVDSSRFDRTRIVSPVVNSLCRKSNCEIRLRANRVEM